MSSFSWTPSEDILENARLARFIHRAGLNDYDDLVARADDDPSWFWNEIFQEFDIEFDTPYQQVVDFPNGPEQPDWCIGGTTNIVSNCIDRFRGTQTYEKTAVVGVSEDGTRCELSYAALDREVCHLASRLRAEGVGRGDVVALYLPMIPEASVAFFAAIKIGAIILPLFSGFGRKPVADRLAIAEAKAVITADFALRKGKRIALAEVAIDAAATLERQPTVFVLDRGATELPDTPARVVRWQSGQGSRDDTETEILPADAPAMLMFTSGTSGAPKGTIHTHCGMLAKNALDMGLCIDMGAEDRLLWMSDMGWIAGPKMVFASALLGATLIIVEGTPTWPDGDRLLRIAEAEKATILGLVPTIARQLKTISDIPPRDLSALRIVLSAGELWTEDAWTWFFNEIGGGRIPILNYAGGTECGGAILIGTLLHPLRPGSFGGPIPGSAVDIIDEAGASVATASVGELVMRRAGIGLTRGLWNEPGRYIEAYWSKMPGMWVQGDLASRDESGLWYLHGRSDDVIKIAGKRTGPGEIESVVIETEFATDCAVVGVADAISGLALACVYVPREATADPEAEKRAISDTVARVCGASYRPRHLLRVTELPRTRNDKTMRRLVRSILTGAPIGDVSSLANPSAIETIRAAAATQLSLEANNT